VPLARITTTCFAVLAVTLAAETGRRSSRFDDADRSAFQAWFTFLADAQYERRAPDVVDCASLVRHAYREALRTHSPEWMRRSQLPLVPAIPDVRDVPPITDGTWLLFRSARNPDRFAEFVDAATLVRLNARFISSDARAAQPGDLLYFHQAESRSPDHIMVFVGESRFERSGRDWLVYHTGPDGRSPGEVRKLSLAVLEQHPSPRWRPIRANEGFVGVFRLAILDREGP